MGQLSGRPGLPREGTYMSVFQWLSMPVEIPGWLALLGAVSIVFLVVCLVSAFSDNTCGRDPSSDD